LVAGGAHLSPWAHLATKGSGGAWAHRAHQKGGGGGGGDDGGDNGAGGGGDEGICNRGGGDGREQRSESPSLTSTPNHGDIIQDETKALRDELARKNALVATLQDDHHKQVRATPKSFNQ